MAIDELAPYEDDSDEEEEEEEESGEESSGDESYDYGFAGVLNSSSMKTQETRPRRLSRWGSRKWCRHPYKRGMVRHRSNTNRATLMLTGKT